MTSDSRLVMVCLMLENFGVLPKPLTARKSHIIFLDLQGIQNLLSLKV